MRMAAGPPVLPLTRQLLCPTCPTRWCHHLPQECTTFHFDVKPDALHPALDRFAQFFIAPLVGTHYLWH